MYILSGIVTLGSLALLALGILGLPFKRFRRSAGRLAITGIVIFITGAIGIAKFDPANEEAASKGFKSTNEMRSAKAEGIETKVEWIKHQEQLAKNEEAERRALIADANERGFPNVTTYIRAQQAGFNTMADWTAHLAAERHAEQLTAYRAAIGKNLIAIDELERVEGPALQVRMKTNGLTPNLDFADVGNTVSDIAKVLRQRTAPYVSLVVIVSVDTIDKYGNPGGLSKAAVLIWDLSELAKVNLDFGPDYIFSNAREVDLSRFGRLLASAYCKNHELTDPRYCS